MSPASRVEAGRVRIAERHKIPGVRYAVTDDGIELPVIDVMHPAFAIDVRPEDLPGIEEASLREIRRATRLPRFIARILGHWSPILRGTMQASGGVLDGMTTYLYKLGPRNLGRGYSCGIDRQLNSQIGPVGVRLRFHTLVRLQAETLAAALAGGAGGRSLRIVNLGGGTALDSVNALRVLRRDRPEVFDGTAFAIDVLDPDPAGPSFGIRALAAWREPGGPLAGIDVSLRHRPYDWTAPAELREIASVDGWAQVAVGCSEGALLEYAPDGVVSANLRMLGELLPRACPLIASSIRPGRILEVWRDVAGMPFQIRTDAQLAALVEQSGWTVESSIAAGPAHRVVRLRNET